MKSNPGLKRRLPSWRTLQQTLSFKKFIWNSRKRRLAKAITIWDLRKIAKKRTPIGPFDYTDGAAESEISLDRARELFRRIEFSPRVLRDVSEISLARQVLGFEAAMPFGLAPTGFTRMMHAEGEIAVARAAGKFSIPYALSTVGTTAIEELIAHAPNTENWFQLYMWKDRDASFSLLERAKRLGVKNLILTVDVPVAGARLRDIRNGLTVPPSLTARTIIEALPKREWWWNFLTTKPLEFASMNNWPGTIAELLDHIFDPTMTFEDLKWIRDNWSGTLTVKGIQNLDDCRRAVAAGAEAIILSNHGGRQLDRAPAPLSLVSDAVREFGKDAEVHIDTGIMDGGDIIAAIALGARFTYVGRAYLYGLMAGGQSGVERAIEILQGQMVRTMKLLGVSSLEELDKSYVKLP
jgi:L-lactate dehydrogenase (cytochrome)